MFQLQIEQCPHDDIEQLSDNLEGFGAVSVSLTDKHGKPIIEAFPGATPLWPDVIVQAHFIDEAEARLAQQMLSNVHPHLTYCLDTLPEQDWERVCLDQFTPQRFGQRLWVCPSWLTPPEPQAVNLILDPGLAFGTGSHATTSMCLQWLDGANLNHKHVIDFGCGSGILAIAALKLGAAHAYAVDIDEQALLATQNNATSNDILSSQLTISQPEELNTTVDVLLANILLAPLLALKHRLRELVKNNGVLVVSGILAEQMPTLITAYEAETDFVHASSVVNDNWGLVVFKISV